MSGSQGVAKYHPLVTADGGEPGPRIMKAAMAASGCGSSSRNAQPRDPQECFVWNRRRCFGTALHTAALVGDLATVADLLQADTTRVSRRFTYETEFKGTKQEGSGEAIHLAASRGHIDVVRVLLEHGARLDAFVTRDFQDHYDVLHAAVFAEGCGGQEPTVRFLLEMRAELTRNLAGQWPLHLAFQTGAVELLPLLRIRMLEQFKGECLPLDPNVPTPLQLGIRSGHMSGRELAMAASLSTCSLRTFIEEEPLCIPAFLKRLKIEAQLPPCKLAAHICREDLDRLIVDCPEAALAVLDSTTAKPRAQNIGQHPVPARVSFQARSTLERLRNMFNPSSENLSYYERDRAWKFDAVRFQPPAWHRQIVGGPWGKPFRDADVKVCHLPNLIAAPFFSALVDASGGTSANEESLEIFKSSVVRGAIHYAWWNGPCRLDLLHVFFSVWGLLLMIYDSIGSNCTQLSDDFISSKGAVDVAFLLIRCAGWRACGCDWKRKLFTRDAVWDLCRSVIPMMLPFTGTHSPVRIMVVFTYWWQLLGFFTFSEYIARAFLPILRLSSGLYPAVAMTLVWFFAFLEAFQVVRDGGKSDFWVNLTATFSTLLTASFPEDIQASSGLEIVMCYFAIAFFTVYLLNIFIGVIGELHQTQKELCTETFQLVRATKCMDFLASAHILPCKLSAKAVATRVAFLAGVVGVSLQWVGWTAHHAWPWMRTALAACQFVMVIATYQNPNAHWSSGQGNGDVGETGDNRYLWIITAREDEEEDAEDPQESDKEDDSEEESIWHYRW